VCPCDQLLITVSAREERLDGATDAGL